MARRVAAFVDGFNLYHGICALRSPCLKWLNLWDLCEIFCPAPSLSLREVHYFSAYATWLPDPYRRHRQYVAALEAVGVTVTLSPFKRREVRCHRCSHKWLKPEEKETDVRLAISLLDAAQRNTFDRALLITGDSDLAPAVRLVTDRFPQKEVQVIFPPKRGRAKTTLRQASSVNPTSIQKIHLERSLLPKEIDVGGSVVARRPPEYAPPPSR